GQVKTLMEMVGGHPYLLRKALYSIASGEYTFEELLKEAPEDDGPLGDHLRRHLLGLQRIPEAGDTMKEVIRNKPCHDTDAIHRLRAVGLVEGSVPDIEPTAQIYVEYFKEKL
ncbi:MAG TPA: hypothetical protein DCP28_36140, partial [Cytophagales bacterium]|nr:hypothetical protein [Cytophagales bacterium]